MLNLMRSAGYPDTKVFLFLFSGAFKKCNSHHAAYPFLSSVSISFCRFASTICDGHTICTLTGGISPHCDVAVATLSLSVIATTIPRGWSFCWTNSAVAFASKSPKKWDFRCLSGVMVFRREDEEHGRKEQKVVLSDGKDLEGHGDVDVSGVVDAVEIGEKGLLSNRLIYEQGALGTGIHVFGLSNRSFTEITTPAWTTVVVRVEVDPKRRKSREIVIILHAFCHSQLFCLPTPRMSELFFLAFTRGSDLLPSNPKLMQDFKKKVHDDHNRLFSSVVHVSTAHLFLIIG